MKIDISTLRENLIMNPQTMEDNENRLLCRTFDKTAKISFPSILEQFKNRFPARVEIDKAVLKVLGFADDEAEILIDKLYPAIVNEIEALKTLMAG